MKLRQRRIIFVDFWGQRPKSGAKESGQVRITWVLRSGLDAAAWPGQHAILWVSNTNIWDGRWWLRCVQKRDSWQISLGPFLQDMINKHNDYHESSPSGSNTQGQGGRPSFSLVGPFISASLGSWIEWRHTGIFMAQYPAAILTPSIPTTIRRHQARPSPAPGAARAPPPPLRSRSRRQRRRRSRARRGQRRGRCHGSSGRSV